MAEYIEREALIKQFCERCNEEMSESPCEPSECFAREVIIGVPAVGVAPVRHGRWEWHEEWSNSTTEHYAELESCGWYCSHCGIELGEYLTTKTGEILYLDDDFREPLLDFCPNCGAKMDLVEDEEHG